VRQVHPDVLPEHLTVDEPGAIVAHRIGLRHFGGTFKIAPGASLTDGKLDAVSFHDTTPVKRLSLFAAAIAGTHPKRPEVKVEQGDAFTLQFDAPPPYETDGEYNVARSGTVIVRCVPRALRVVGGV
jgi:diacylglycerol kinase (ATP)